jgi:DNA processing protein
MSDPRRYWLGFSLVKGIGAVRLRKLLDFFGDAETAWNAPQQSLIESGLTPKLSERVIQVRATIHVDRLWDETLAKGITVITWDDAGYPSYLLNVDQPPPILYLRGSLTSDDAYAVAIVGTRNVTPYGRQVTEELASFLARNGVTIVSGLARGVDAIAHTAALKSGGRTLAVLGSGVDRIYPPEHQKLALEMIQHGAIISDYAPGTPPDASNFPPRNRIISGLSLAVVVIEAGETSGALITAEFALEQGREIFAVPGNIFAPQSKGPNRLIRSGAHPLTEWKDILEVLNLTRNTEQRAVRTIIPADDVEARLLRSIGHEPVHVDDIRNASGLPIEKVSAALTMMELKGMVRQVGGMQYVSARETQEGYEA